jgi:hypothetical protein
MKLSLPTSLRTWALDQAKEAGYADVNDYFVEMLEKERARKEREEIENDVRDALNSGPAKAMNDLEWKKLRVKARKRLAAKRSKVAT